jgi:hypothetical protein
MIANGHHWTEEMQPYRVIRFLETGGEYDPLSFPDGQKPPLLPRLCRGHLDSPLALANEQLPRYGPKAVENYARFVMKSVITHLRHGLLYYYYNTEIPETGPGSGEYGPLNHTFPITPVELHEGWILGKERIITAVSGTYPWQHSAKPKVHCFDLTGREIPADFPVVRVGKGWEVEVRLKDWEEMVVIE